MSDKLVVEIDSKDAEVAMRNLDRLTAAAEQMGKAFENTKGATSALRELRLMLTGIKGQGSSLDELKNSIQSLNSTADSLKRSFAGSVGQLGRIFKNEMAELKSIVQETSLGVGRAAAKGIEDGMAEAPAAIRKQGRTIAAAAKAEATRIYEAMVAGQANAKIKDVGALFKLDEAGATLSPYHKQVLENWKKSSAETFRAMKAQLATEREQLEGQVKAENEALQSALKRMEGESKTRNASLTSIYRSSLARGNSSISQVRTALKAEAAQLQATVKSENDALQTALQSMESNSRDKAKSLAAIYRDSLGRGNFAMAQVKSRLKAESSELQAAVKAEESELQRALQAMEASDKLRKSSLAEIYAGSLKRGDQGIARVKVQLREQADNIIQANKTELARVQAQVAAATNNAGGLYQKYNASTQRPGAITNPNKIPDVSKSLPKPAEIDAVANSFKRLTIDGNDAHSMARGLASGFNLLWLTWGNLAPLFVGAAISNGFMQTAKTGMEVAHTFETIAVLGGNTAQEMAALSAELDRLGKSGPFGPKEIAESMKTLSLAGLKANEILAVTKDVLNFSVAGTTDLKTAADALVSISTAFGMGAQGFGRVADVVSKAAAESKSSVESFANAMKTASVIHKQYGVSLEDTATGIAALSQLGIEGTAAGTALRNMYADLSGRSMQVAKALKAQGIEMRTATGEFRPMLEVVAELNDKLLKLDGISQKNLLQAILSERGAKGMVELLQLIQQEAKNMGSGLSNSLAELQRNITESYGFAAISAAQLAQTTQESFKAVKATLSTSMNEAYQAMEPTLYLLADTLKKTFSSPEFISGLTTMVSFVANLARSFIELTKFVVEHAEAVALVSAAYVGVTMLIRNKATAMAAATAATVADTAATVANNAAKAGAAGALGTMARILPGIGTAVSLAAVAWSAYDLWQNRAKDTAKEAADVYNTNVVNTLKDQADKLERLNALRATGISLSEAQARLDAEGKVQDSTLGARGGLKSALAEVSDAENELAKVRNNFFFTEGLRASALEKAQNRVSEATKKAVQAQVQVNNAAADSETQLLRIREESRKKAEWMDAEAKARQEKLAKGFGTGAFSLVGTKGTEGTNSNPSIRQESYTEQKALAEITKARDAELANTKRSYDLQKQLLDNKHKNELLSRTEYVNQVQQQTETFEENQLRSLTDYNDKYQDQSLKAIEELQRNEAIYLKAGNKDKADNFASLAETQREAAIRVAKDTAEKVTNIQQEAAARNQIIIQDMVGEANKLLKADDKLWKEREDKLEAAKALEAINDQYKYLNTSVFSAAEGEKAYARAMAETSASVKAQNKDLEKLAEHLQAVADAQYAIIMSKDYSGQEDGMSQADMDRLEKLMTAREGVKKLRERIASNTENGFKQGAAEGVLAMNKVMKEKQDVLVGGIAGAIEIGIGEGAAEGGKALRKVLEDELLRKPFRAFIQASVNLLVNGVSGSVLGGGAAGGGSNIMGGVQTASNLNTLYGAGSQALFGASAGASAASLAYANAVGMAGGDAIGALATANGMWAGVATGAQAAAQAAIASNAAMAAGTAAALPAGTTAAAAGAGGAASTGALAAIPGWGWALAGVAALAGLGSLFGAAGTQEYGAVAQYSAASGTKTGKGGYEQNSEWYNFGTGFGGVAYNEAIASNVSGITQSIVTALDATAKTFGQTVGYEAAAGFASDFGEEATWGGLRIALQGTDLVNWDNNRQSKWAPKEFASGEEGYKQYLAAIAKDTRQVLLDMDLPSWADTILTSIGEAATMDQLSAALQQIGAIKATFEQLGKSIEGFAGITGGMESALLNAAGGIDALRNSAGTYYENFYTEAEKTANVTRSVSESLAQVGLAMPATRDEFRALVESQLAMGEAGAEAVSALLGVSGAFASVVPAAEEASTAIGAIKEAAENMRALRGSLIDLESGFAGGGFSRQYRAEDAAGTVSGLLADVGIQKDAGMLAQQMLSATSGEVEAYFREIWDVLETDEARQKLVDVTGVMMDLAQGAGSASEALQKQQDNLQALAEDASRLFSARNSAGALMDRISGAMGKQGAFGAQRESELWGALGSTRDAEKQVELASQLTDLVLSRQQLEVQNAERMLDFGRSLRSYVDGLKLGELSPLTNAEKLAEASAQYNEMLGKAQGGDADAQAGLQGIASTYLDLARTYFAGNEQFSAIFGAVTSSLDALGVSSMSEAQQQLSLGTQSLGELQKLYSITETAYGSLNAQYETAVGELAAAQDALVLQSDSLDQLKDIAGLLSGLPAEIAVRLPAINTEATTYLPLTMPVQQGDNAALIAELQALREEVAYLRAENRQDAQMVAGATVASASASASQIADATTKAAYTTTVKQGAVLV